jgi:general secretion pathway protein G
VEVLIVLAIILILSGTTGFVAFRFVGQARHVAARSQIETLALALDGYALDCRQYPTPEQGLDALWAKPTREPVPVGWNGPYMSKRIPSDPWTRPYEYTLPGPHGLPFGLRSLGADGREGGEGLDRDVCSWED